MSTYGHWDCKNPVRLTVRGKFPRLSPEFASCSLEREAWPRNSESPFTSCRSSRPTFSRNITSTNRSIRGSGPPPGYYKPASQRPPLPRRGRLARDCRVCLADWIALPPELELGPTISIYQAPEDVPEDGPARVLLGSYGSASSAIASPSPINYLAVRLKAGERWRYEPPTGHTVLWVAIASGVLSAPDELRHGDLAAFEPSSKAVEFEALTDTEFVLGSAAPHEHDLVLGHYSVHTSPDALRDAEAHISAIRTRLVQEGRL